MLRNISNSSGMLRITTIVSIFIFTLWSCKSKDFGFDASGTFESTEILVSSEVAGKIMKINLIEGDIVEKGVEVGYIDTVQLYLQKMQLYASKNAIKASRPDLKAQTAAVYEQLEKAKFEKKRIENLLKDGAATQKQADDIDSQIKVLERNIAAQTSTISVTSQSIDAQSNTVDVQIAQLNNKLEKSRIINPISGTVIAKYSEESEVVAAGKPLYKIADMQNLFLRSYIVSSQLEAVKLGQPAEITVTYGENVRKYNGKVAWISGKSEFTPKTIQTKDERQNLVYAVKIAVENTDGLIKLGMYGDVVFK